MAISNARQIVNEGWDYNVFVQIGVEAKIFGQEVQERNGHPTYTFFCSGLSENSVGIFLKKKF